MLDVSQNACQTRVWARKWYRMISPPLIMRNWPAAVKHATWQRILRIIIILTRGNVNPLSLAHVPCVLRQHKTKTERGNIPRNWSETPQMYMYVAGFLRSLSWICLLTFVMNNNMNIPSLRRDAISCWIYPLLNLSPAESITHASSSNLHLIFFI